MRRVGGAEVIRHVLVDGNNMLHRAYYAFVEARIRRGEPVLCNKSGYPTGVIYGCMTMLPIWLQSVPNATRVSIFFDGLPKRRRALDVTYKADRLLEADGRTVKFPITLLDGYHAETEAQVLIHLLGLLGCDVYLHPEEEADDLIASFIRTRPDNVHVIISDDKDFFQLLTNPRVAVFRPGMPGGRRMFDAEAAEGHWATLQGGKHPRVPVTHVRMFKSLCGDASDGIVGIDRLRKKVAVPLCSHQDVDSLYATGFPGFSKTEREKTLAARDRIQLNHQLVGMVDNLDVEACCKAGLANFGLAGDILREDLSMDASSGSRVDLSLFRPDYQEPVALPSYDWLNDI